MSNPMQGSTYGNTLIIRSPGDMPTEAWPAVIAQREQTAKAAGNAALNSTEITNVSVEEA